MKDEELPNKILSLLFASAAEISEDELMRHTGATRRQVREAMQKIDVKLSELPMQVMLKDEKKREWKLTLKARYLGVVQNLGAETELTKGALDVLAIIAYKEPIMQSEIIRGLGSGAYDHIKMLLEAGFITKQPKGRSFTLKLAENFYKYFEMGEKDSKKMLSERAEKMQGQKSMEEFNQEQYENDPGESENDEDKGPGVAEAIEESVSEKHAEKENEGQDKKKA